MSVKALFVIGYVALSEGVSQLADVTGTAGSDSCACLNWAELYYYQKAKCGHGLELYFLSKNGFNPAYAATEPITGLPHKVCYDFFKNFLYDSCLNVDLLPFPADHNTGKQWCYVSNMCGSLNGGQAGTNRMGHQQVGWNNLKAVSTRSWKYCTPGQDSMLNSWTVQQVLDLGKALDISLSRLLRLSFPAVEITWAKASFFYEQLQDAYLPNLTVAEMAARVDPMTGWDNATAQMEVQLREIAGSDQATVLDSIGHGDEFHVVQGRAVYEVARVADGDMAYLGGHFYKEFAVTCLMGCSMAPRLGSDIDMDTV